MPVFTSKGVKNISEKHLEAIVFSLLSLHENPASTEKRLPYRYGTIFPTGGSAAKYYLSGLYSSINIR
jgi:hypothetical protein